MNKHKNPVDDDTRPFNIQGSYDRNKKKPSTIPWWLAEIAYKEYSDRFGTSQSLETLNQRGGFGRTELIKFLRKDRNWG